ncbi:dynamin family protein [Cytobacillus firmus]|uniref:dynamin family protein n=1 Tax=Cytobacillus firmus TaxID=1399 RepID=UPI0024957057|nr:dynamin family protein [Cytobacillus firmus]
MIHNLNKKRNHVIQMFDSIKRNVSSEAINESGLVDIVDKLRSSSFRIALVAPFSAGKSTFVNALIGKDLLSMDVLAETAAITKLKYGKQKRIEVKYRDGQSELFPQSASQVSTEDQLKAFLKSKTTVNRETAGETARVEETVESVNVYWDLDLCKGGLEIVDTPGLFARHSEHDQITTKILPSVDAILFIIEPDNVGESNFLNVITDYVENAKNSSLDTDGKHIFFIINKVDKFTEKEILNAREELYRVVSPLLKSPQILAVSSYFAMKARMFDNGSLSLNDLKRDQHISFVDEEGFVVSGRQITENDIGTIHTIGRMGVIEKELSAFFEHKISRMVNESIESLAALCAREIRDSVELVQLLKKRIGQKEGEYEKKLKALRTNFQELTRVLKTEVEHDAIQTLVGTSTGQSKIEEVIEEVKSSATPKLAKELRADLYVSWKAKREELTEHNSEQILDQFLENLLLKLQTKKKSLIRTSFRSLEKQYERFTEGLLGRFSQFEENVNKTFSAELNLTALSGQSAFFQKEQLLFQVRNDIEELFSATSYDIRSDLKERLKNLKEDNTYLVNASGFFNAIKALFGKAEKVSVFDMESFQLSLDELVYQIIADAEEEIRIDANAISTEINNRIISVNEKYQGHILKRIEHYQGWRERNIQNLLNELKGEKGKVLNIVAERERSIQSLEKLIKQVKEFYEEEFIEKGEAVYAI